MSDLTSNDILDTQPPLVSRMTTQKPEAKKQSAPVGRRVQIGVMIAVPSLIAIYWGGWIFSAFVALFVWLAHKELIEIMRARYLHPSRLIILSTAVIMII